ncbi:hypothetical protein DE146DRAFT_663781 [Phaeosphaeria sp. MPI-PUGE-AT-0046c]|nr:hypothetical protein DE146DRAFT_663781 [Phaeosphaeria sp. MPI-PUGE-AT-0046c]
MDPATPPEAEDLQPDITATEYEYGVDASPLFSTSLSLNHSAMVLPPDQSHEPATGTNRLLALPRELRDQIFGLALGHGPIRLNHTGLKIDLVHITNTVWATIPRRHASCGLYSWMRSSKQILSETLDAISRNFTFMLSSRLPAARMRIPPANTLVLVHGRVQNIFIISAFVVSKSPVTGRLTTRKERMTKEQRDFVLLMKTLAAQNLSLSVVWYIVVESRPASDVSVYDIPWAKFWTGQIRQVKIQITSLKPEYADDISMLMGYARRFAKQLAGEESREMIAEVTEDKEYYMPGLYRYKKIIVHCNV